MSVTLEKHLKKARTRAHEVQRENGHYKRMAKLSWANKVKELGLKGAREYMASIGRKGLKSRWKN